MRQAFYMGLIFIMLHGMAAGDVLHPFRYGDVRLTGGPLGAQAGRARSFFLNLSEDSLLKGFRQRAGQPAPGHPMGGWYDPDDFAAAHPFGQFVSALSRMYAGTGDVRYQQKVARLVHGFHQTIRPDGYFFASAKVAAEWPCYLYDKNCTGMRDAFTLAGDTEALTVLRRMTDWAVPNLSRWSDEWYTLAENLYNCEALTHDPRYLRLAAEFQYPQFWDSLADGVNAFTPVRHAYSHVNSLCSAARAYEQTGDPRYLRTIENGWRFLTTTQMYASGGWGPGEHWVVPGHGNLAASLKTTAAGFETPCGSYANVNLDRYLLRFTGRSQYGDNMERVLFNGMLTALPMQADGRTFYYSDYRPGAHKHYFRSAWPCCAGTYAEITADYPTDIYFYDASGLYVNLFTPSVVSWGQVRMVQTTDFPLSNKAMFRFTAAGRQRFALNVRVPAWTGGSMQVAVNGQAIDILSIRDGFAHIERTWRAGDTVTIELPMSLRFEAIDSETAERVALMYGPILLVALADGDVTLRGDRAEPSTWVKRLGPDLTFRAGDVTFRPLYRVQTENYTTYCRLDEPPAAGAKQP